MIRAWSVAAICAAFAMTNPAAAQIRPPPLTCVQLGLISVNSFTAIAQPGTESQPGGPSTEYRVRLVATRSVKNVWLTFWFGSRQQITIGNVNLPLGQEVEVRLGAASGTRLTTQQMHANLRVNCQTA